MKEIIKERETFGWDERAINRHSVRSYTHNGKKYHLDRTLDGVPPFFTLFELPEVEGLSYPVKVKGQDYWGDGISWEKAEEWARQALNYEYGGDPDELPTHVIYPRESDFVRLLDAKNRPCENHTRVSRWQTYYPREGGDLFEIIDTDGEAFIVMYASEMSTSVRAWQQVILPKEPKYSRDFLHEHGRMIVEHSSLNHEEYEYKGKVYVCGWASPAARFAEAGGWHVHEKEDEEAQASDL